MTHRDVFATGEERAGQKAWPLWQCLVVLGTATVAAAEESELVSSALTDAAGHCTCPPPSTA